MRSPTARVRPPVRGTRPAIERHPGSALPWAGQPGGTPPTATTTGPDAGRPPADGAWRKGGAFAGGSGYCLAFHFSQSMFQPLSPLSGWMVLSLDFLISTTSPMMEFL